MCAVVCDQCEDEDEGLAHLLKYREQHEDTTLEEERERNNVGAMDEDDRAFASMMKDLFHVSALQVLNPLEFKEVKMLAVEILAKLPIECVLPFALSHLLAFAQDELSRSGATAGKLTMADGDDTMSSITKNISRRRRALAAAAIPQRSCGLVAAKLLVYYLNRVLVEGTLLSGDDDTWTASTVLGVLFLLLRIPCDGDGSDAALLADLQLGCIDWIAQLLLPSTLAINTGADSTDITDDDWEQFVELLIDWMVKGDAMPSQESIMNGRVGLIAQVRKRMCRFVPLAGDYMPLQFRICCCNVLLRYDRVNLPRHNGLKFLTRFFLLGGDVSALRKLDEQHDASCSRALAIARRVLDSIRKCVESELVAGGLEVRRTPLCAILTLSRVR